jgi:hypothetical protein
VFAAIVFYAGINLGFNNKQGTQLNSKFWLSAYLHYLSELDLSSQCSGITFSSRIIVFGFE